MNYNHLSNRGRNWHNKVIFGLHYDLHAGTEDTDLGAALTHEYLKAELAKIMPDWVQCDCKGHGGITSWPTEVGTPSPGIVKDALRIHRDVTRELGIPLIMHYSGVIDRRATELHPEWARVRPDAETGEKPGAISADTCTLSAYTRDLMIPQMIELIDKYDVDGFWVDGENWAVQICYCDRCRTAFRDETGIAEPPKAPDQPHWLEWAAFHRKNFVNHVAEYADAIHARKPDCTVCSNWMYTYGQPDAVDAPIDYMSGDVTPNWGIAQAMFEGRFAQGRGLTNPGMSWDLMAWAFVCGDEGWSFKHAPALCQDAAVVISLGGAVSFYTQPHRSGRLTGWYQDTMAEAGLFVRARQKWCEAAESVRQAVVLHNSPHFYANCGDKLMLAESNKQRPVIGALNALLENHVHADVLNENALAAQIGDYKLVVIPEQTHISDELFAAVERYVRGGGRLIVSGLDIAQTRFGSLAQLQPDGEPREYHLAVQVGDETTMVMGPWQPVKPDGDAPKVTHYVLSDVDPSFDSPVMPAATLTVAGQGRVAAIPGALFGDYGNTHYPRTRKLIGEIIAGLEPDLLVSMDAPARVHFVLRRQEARHEDGGVGGERLIVHLINMGASHPLSPQPVVVEDIPRVGPIGLRIACPKKPARVYLAPGMEGLTWTWADGRLNVKVDSIGIMDSVVVEV